MILAIIFVMLAGFFSAVMDKTKDSIQKNTSVFRNLGQFWDDSQPASMVPFTKYKINAWHMAKTCMGFSFLGVAFAFHRVSDPNAFHFAVLTFCGILSFDFFYNIVLKK